MTTTRSPVHAGEADRWGGWSWRDPTRGEHFRRCSYCGSVHPEDLAAEPVGWRASWADRKYGWPHKFYVDIVNRDPARFYVIGSSKHPFEGAIAVADMTPEQLEILERDGYLGDGPGWHPTHVQFGTRRSHFGKVYSVHLADPEISDDAKAAIGERCGLRFEFLDDGRIRWQPAS